MNFMPDWASKKKTTEVDWIALFYFLSITFLTFKFRDLCFNNEEVISWNSYFYPTFSFYSVGQRNAFNYRYEPALHNIGKNVLTHKIIYVFLFLQQDLISKLRKVSKSIKITCATAKYIDFGFTWWSSAFLLIVKVSERWLNGRSTIQLPFSVHFLSCCFCCHNTSLF